MIRRAKGLNSVSHLLLFVINIEVLITGAPAFLLVSSENFMADQRNIPIVFILVGFLLESVLIL